MLAAAAHWAVGSLPFALLLLAIAVLPLIPSTAHWWHSNKNKAIISLACALATCAYLVATDDPSEIVHILDHALIGDYVPFIILLGSVYVVAGGIAVRGDLVATPATNTGILAAGTLLASVLGTTGASMLLIRLLLSTNKERTRVAHTVVFFIFLVSNIGGTLLPIGDPPLFLGYLKGVPFFWTLTLWKPWLFASGFLLIVYYAIDMWMIRHEPPSALRRDLEQRHKFHALGYLNLVWLAGILASVILLVPGRLFLGSDWEVPNYAREGAMAGFALASLASTRTSIRTINQFSWGPIIEVAVLFLGIFVAMQVPLAALKESGPSLGLATQPQFFWATGVLSSFLDNAPTYLVFLATASSLSADHGIEMVSLVDGTQVSASLLAAISLGAVFMGANTYIGNGPNFMVKAIAERSGVKMPGFFGYMAWAAVVLLPLFALVTVLFLR